MSLPRAYLRIDPNLDAHPDQDAMLTLILFGNRCSERGRFRSLSMLEKVLGKKRLKACLERKDLVPISGGRFYVSGWDDWQEGDLTVGERMGRIRKRRSMEPEELPDNERNDAVTLPSPERITGRNSPSEALTLTLGVETNQQKQTPVVVIPERTDADDARDELRQALMDLRAKSAQFGNLPDQAILDYPRFFSSGGGICRIDTCTNPGLLRATAAKVRNHGKPPKGKAPRWDIGLQSDVTAADLAWDPRLGPRPEQLQPPE